jgi:hypothetical protein
MSKCKILFYKNEYEFHFPLLTKIFVGFLSFFSCSYKGHSKILLSSLKYFLPSIYQDLEGFLLE